MKINQILFFPVVKIDSNYNLPSGKSVNYVKKDYAKKFVKLKDWRYKNGILTKLLLPNCPFCDNKLFLTKFPFPNPWLSKLLFNKLVV